MWKENKSRNKPMAQKTETKRQMKRRNERGLSASHNNAPSVVHTEEKGGRIGMKMRVTKDALF
jgi:hypothetical protein